MSNTGNVQAESDAAGILRGYDLIEESTRNNNVHAAGVQLIAAGQQLKTFGACTSVATSLKAAGEYLVAAGLSAPGNSLIAAGESFAEVAGSQFAGASQSEGPGTSQFPVRSSSQELLGRFSLGAWDQVGLVNDSEPTLEFNELTFSEAAGSGHSGESLPQGSQSAESEGSQSSGSGSDSSDRDGELIVGAYKSPSFLKRLHRSR